MKYKLLLCLFAVTFVAASALAQTKETRTVETFTKLAFRTPGKLILRQGSPQKVELEGKKEVLDKIETEVDGNKLNITVSRQWSNRNWNSGDFKVYVTVKNLDEISVSGSGDLITETKFTGDKFSIHVSGSGSLVAELEASGNIDSSLTGSGNLDIKGTCMNFDSHVSGSGDLDLAATMSGDASFGISGSGKVRARGKAASVRATLTGSGQILASDFETDKCNVTISGSGDAEINVKSELDATIAGSGSVSYKGNPGHVNSHATGSGRVSKMN